MDSHTPLTAAEIEDWRNILEANKSLNPCKWPEARVISEKMFKDFPRLLSMLTPPTDAALREAVENAQQGLCVPTLNPDNPYCAVDKMAVRTLIRAVQATRLTGEQREAVQNVVRKTESRQCICGDGYLCARCEILGDVCAAFPGVCEEG